MVLISSMNICVLLFIYGFVIGLPLDLAARQVGMDLTFSFMPPSPIKSRSCLGLNIKDVRIKNLAFIFVFIF